MRKLHLPSRLFLALSLLAPLCLPLEAGVNTWSCIGPPGGLVSEFGVDPLHSGVVFAIADGGALHRTTDFGAHWTVVPYAFGGTRSIAVHPHDAKLILVGGRAVFRSTDGGGTWIETDGPRYLNDIAFAPANPNVVYIAGTQGVWKSTDTGFTWARFASGLPPGRVFSHVAAATEGNAVYASDGVSIYVSTDGGSSWGLRTNGITTATNLISTLAVDPANGQTAYTAVRFEGLYKTTNGGAAWAKASTDAQVSSLVQDLKFSPYSSQILYAAASWASGLGVVKSTNGGVNWTTLKEGLRDSEIVSVGLDPQNSQVLYAGSKWSGAFVTTDGGQHWSLVKSGLNNHTIDAFLQDPSDPHFLYAAARGEGIYRTSDAGATWEQANTGLPPGRSIVSLAWVPGAPASLFAGGPGVYRSTDRGATWVARSSGIENEFVRCLVVDPVSDVGTLYAGTESGKVFRTIDAGNHWNAASTGLPSARITALVPDLHESGRVFAVTDYAGTFRSLNHGESWFKLTAAPENGDNLVIDATRKGYLYLRANDRVLRSSDAGDTWVAASGGLPQSTGTALTTDLSRSGTLYTSDFYGTYRSVNGGDQWTDFSQGLIEPRNVNALYSNGVASPIVYAATSCNSVHAITLDYSNVFYFPQVGDGTAGPVSVKTSFILVNTGDRSDVRVDFFDSLANPMRLSLGSQGTGPAFATSLGRGEAISLQTPGIGNLNAGYARISTGPSVGGTAVFTYADQGVIQYESGVPGVKPLKEFSLFMDSSGTSRETGVALVNTGTAATVLHMRLYSTSFELLSTRVASPFLPGHHLPRYAPEIFPEVNTLGVEQGVMTVNADQALAAVTLRQNNDPALSFPQEVVTMSTFPVIAGRADGPASAATNTVFYFPQMADGRLGTTRFHTTLVLVNSRGAASSAQIEFFGSDASRMNVQLGSLGTNHTFGIPLAPGQAVSLETAGSGALQAGYAKVTTDSGVGGTVVFTLEENGLTLYDAGVPASSPQKNMTFFMDASGGNYDTGFALVNTAGSPAHVTLRLYDTSFNLLQTVDLRSVLGGSDLGPGRHVARYATEVFPLIRSQHLERGVITIESSEPLAAITLRQQDKPGVGLPGDVYLVTAFPVIPGRAQ